MYKVVINGCYGGFGLSKASLDLIEEKYPNLLEVYQGKSVRFRYLKDDVLRHDKRLVEVVEELGSEKASGDCANLVIEIIYNPVYRISDYDGYESVDTQDMDEGWVVIEEGLGNEND